MFVKDARTTHCEYSFTWESLFACPICTASQYRPVYGACVNGRQIKSYIWKDNPKRCHGGVDLPLATQVSCSAVRPLFETLVSFTLARTIQPFAIPEKFLFRRTVMVVGLAPETRSVLAVAISFSNFRTPSPAIQGMPCMWSVRTVTKIGEPLVTQSSLVSLVRRLYGRSTSSGLAHSASK